MTDIYPGGGFRGRRLLHKGSVALINHFGGGHIGGVDPDHIGGLDQEFIATPVA